MRKWDFERLNEAGRVRTFSISKAGANTLLFLCILYVQEIRPGRVGPHQPCGEAPSLLSVRVPLAALHYFAAVFGNMSSFSRAPTLSFMKSERGMLRGLHVPAARQEEAVQMFGRKKKAQGLGPLWKSRGKPGVLTSQAGESE